MNGQDIVRSLPSAPSAEREAAVFALLGGAFLAPVVLVPVDYDRDGHHVRIFAAADALSVGDEDPVRLNATHPTAQAFADALGLMLPTSLMADAAWRAASKIAPQNDPLAGALGHDMASTEAMIAHSLRVDHARDVKGIDKGALLRPVGKDWVNSERLLTSAGAPAVNTSGGPGLASANYGWQGAGSSLSPGPFPGGVHVLQPIGLRHDRGHTDYSQTISLYGRTCVIDGEERNVEDVLGDPSAAYLLSGEVHKGEVARVTRLPDSVDPGFSNFAAAPRAEGGDDEGDSTSAVAGTLALGGLAYFLWKFLGAR